MTRSRQNCVFSTLLWRKLGAYKNIASCLTGWHSLLHLLICSEGKRLSFGLPPGWRWVSLVLNIEYHKREASARQGSFFFLFWGQAELKALFSVVQWSSWSRQMSLSIHSTSSLLLTSEPTATDTGSLNQRLMGQCSRFLSLSLCPSEEIWLFLALREPVWAKRNSV